MHVLVALANSNVIDKAPDAEDVKPGWVALGIVIILCIAVFFLCRSFIKHTKKAEQPWEGEDADSGARRTTPHDRS
ncbi:hypothetical protein [Aeromicrobium sp. UC242_57]|uniref:hypothetical protein n=1 Tax=Aeromicrobium sp. UC242_57 TaxID=3374624 RepID=UPI00378FC394